MTKNSTITLSPQRFVIDQALLQSVLEYLSQRPYVEVAQAINELRALPAFIPENPKAAQAMIPHAPPPLSPSKE